MRNYRIENEYEEAIDISENIADGIQFVIEANFDSCLNLDIDKSEKTILEEDLDKLEKTILEEDRSGLLGIYGTEYRCMISHLEDINRCS